MASGADVDRTACLSRRNGRHDGHWHRASRLAPETATQTPESDVDFVLGEAQCQRDILVDVLRPLCGGVHRHAAVLVGTCHSHLRLQVEMQLAAAVHFAFDDLQVGCASAAEDGLERCDVAFPALKHFLVLPLGGHGLRDRHYWCLDVSPLHFDDVCGFACGVFGGGEHQGDRLADEARLTPNRHHTLEQIRVPRGHCVDHAVEGEVLTGHDVHHAIDPHGLAPIHPQQSRLCMLARHVRTIQRPLVHRHITSVLGVSRDKPLVVWLGQWLPYPGTSSLSVDVSVRVRVCVCVCGAVEVTGVGCCC
mmetsp:Transcript_4964/g.11614  ORF Transcript_4964/g.11614 Transcript_4964/m.11614 type:complete len:306 (-) Transcript_4964:267-1184(-)